MCGHFSDDRDDEIRASEFQEASTPAPRASRPRHVTQKPGPGVSRFVDALGSIRSQYRFAVDSDSGNIVAYARNPSSSAPRGMALSPFHALARYHRIRGQEPVEAVTNTYSLNASELRAVRNAVYNRRGSKAVRSQILAALQLA